MVERYFFPEPKGDSDRSISCFCCRDTGAVISTSTIRDEAMPTEVDLEAMRKAGIHPRIMLQTLALPSALPPVVCRRKTCDAAFRRFMEAKVPERDGSGKVHMRPATHDEILAQLKATYSNTATEQQCEAIHQANLKDFLDSKQRRLETKQAISALSADLAAPVFE